MPAELSFGFASDAVWGSGTVEAVRQALVVYV